MPAAVYVNTLRSIPLVMVILWFFLLIPLVDRAADRRGAVGHHHLHRCSRRRTTREIMRAGIQSIPRGQVYAGYAVGMTYGQNMKLIVLPQAFRNMLPVLLTQTIILFQDTSLVYAIGAYDLLKGFEVGRQELQPPGRDLPARRRRLLHHLLLRCRCWSRRLQKKIAIIR